MNPRLLLGLILRMRGGGRRGEGGVRSWAALMVAGERGWMSKAFSGSSQVSFGDATFGSGKQHMWGLGTTFEQKWPTLVSLPGSQWASFYILYREVENLGHISNSQIRGGSGTLAPTCCLSDSIISLLSFFVFVCRGHSAVSSPLHPPVRTGPKSLCSQLTFHSTEESCLHSGIAHPVRTSASL